MNTHIGFHEEIRKLSILFAGLGGSVGCAVRLETTGGCGFDLRRGRQHSFVEIDHEIFLR